MVDWDWVRWWYAKEEVVHIDGLKNPSELIANGMSCML